MGIRMGITHEVPDFSKYIDCGMAYDYDFIKNLKFVKTACNKCKKKKLRDDSEGDDWIDICYGCTYGTKGYYILPKQILLDNPNVTNYEAMLERFEENNIDEIYLILS